MYHTPKIDVYTPDEWMKECQISYKKFGPSHWQWYSYEDGRIAVVGPIYKTKTELLLDKINYLSSSWNYKNHCRCPHQIPHNGYARCGIFQQ